MNEQHIVELEEIGTILNYSPEIAINQNRATVRNSLVKVSFQFYPEENHWQCSAGKWYGTGDSPAKAYLNFVTARLQDTQDSVTPWSNELTRIQEVITSNIRRQQSIAESLKFIADHNITVDQVQVSSGPNMPWFYNINNFVKWLKENNCKKPYVEWNMCVYDTKVVMEDYSKRVALFEYLFENPTTERELPAKPAETSYYFDFLSYLRKHIAFSSRTFGPEPRTSGILDHIRKELREIETAPYDVEEWIDVAILALDGAWRVGATPEQIAETLVSKLVKNKNRKWPDWRTAPKDKAIEHDRTE